MSAISTECIFVLTTFFLFIILAVPLNSSHPHSVLLYYCNDSNAKLLVTTPEFSELMQRVVKNTGTKLFVLDDKLQQNAIEKVPQQQRDLEGGLSADFYNRGNAMILYTSGTTGNPKGKHNNHFVYIFFAFLKLYNNFCCL